MVLRARAGFVNRVGQIKLSQGLAQGWCSCFCIKTTKQAGLLSNFTVWLNFSAGAARWPSVRPGRPSAYSKLRAGLRAFSCVGAGSLV
jgi:hypothetical protein